MFKFAVGDYVIANQAMFDSWDGVIFKVTSLGYNIRGTHRRRRPGQ